MLVCSHACGGYRTRVLLIRQFLVVLAREGGVVVKGSPRVCVGVVEG